MCLATECNSRIAPNGFVYYIAIYAVYSFSVGTCVLPVRAGGCGRVVVVVCVCGGSAAALVRAPKLPCRVATSLTGGKCKCSRGASTAVWLAPQALQRGGYRARPARNHAAALPRGNRCGVATVVPAGPDIKSSLGTRTAGCGASKRHCVGSSLSGPFPLPAAHAGFAGSTDGTHATIN